MNKKFNLKLMKRIAGLRRPIPTYLLLIFGCLGVSVSAYADWHIGKVVNMGHAYDGSTITFKLSGWSRSNCTCYSPWPDSMCLDRARTSFREDYAWLLRARTTGQSVWANIDENSCKIVALYEVDGT